MKEKITLLNPTCISLRKSAPSYFAFCEALVCCPGGAHVFVKYEHFDRSIIITSDVKTIALLFNLMKYFI